ncbi:MAG: restriction endonuclease [Isosphaeraceae bacterium]
MTRPVSCTQCGTMLDESSDLPPEDRLPCPHCGSTARTFHVFATDIFTATDSAFVSSAPGLLLQAVVTFGDKTNEGQIIESVAPAWFEIARLAKGDPSIIYQIDHRKWEEIIAGAYERAGFEEVILTPRSGDYGRDIIAVKHGYLSVRIIDQVKAYKRDHLVSADDVRALIGVLLTDRNVTKGIVTTTSDFAPRIRTDPSITPHMPFRLELISGKELVERLNNLANA